MRGSECVGAADAASQRIVSRLTLHTRRNLRVPRAFPAEEGVVRTLRNPWAPKLSLRYRLDITDNWLVLL